MVDIDSMTRQELREKDEFGLTVLEREVLRLLGDEVPPSEIAARFNRSKQQIQNVKQRLEFKGFLGVRGPTKAGREALGGAE